MLDAVVSYNPRMLSVEQISDGPIGAGTRFHTKLKAIGRTLRWSLSSSVGPGGHADVLVVGRGARRRDVRDDYIRGRHLPPAGARHLGRPHGGVLGSGEKLDRAAEPRTEGLLESHV